MTEVVQVAPIEILLADKLKEAASGRSSRYVALPGAGPNSFARLDEIASISRSMLRQDEMLHGVNAADERRALSGALARRFGRFAFPDEFNAWVEPLQRMVHRRANKQSPESRAFDTIDEIRVQAHGGWEKPPYTLTFSFLIPPEALPLDREPAGDEAELRDKYQGDSAARIAELLAAAQNTPGANLLWHVLAEKWLIPCADATRPESPFVASYDVEVLGRDEYTLAQADKSERLDLDHLTRPESTAALAPATALAAQSRTPTGRPESNFLVALHQAFAADGGVDLNLPERADASRDVDLT